MNQNQEPENKEMNEITSEQNVETNAQPACPSEFKVTVRKLEMPVRPRGVLAE